MGVRVEENQRESERGMAGANKQIVGGTNRWSAKLTNRQTDRQTSEKQMDIGRC